MQICTVYAFISAIELPRIPAYLPKINQDGQVRYAKGKTLSITISEQGKSYIAERKHEFKKLLLKDVAIPIIVSILTTLALNGLKLLPHLLQLLESHIP